ncbi:DUF397 domain-containing protein [Streptomyces sp. NPDC004629]|uniref:DUF397 domain-containing protein n=1 Tax=Streptomyces sp. NPDC004629 TaxID=3364705 RepID=UPI00367F6B38
MKTPTRWKKSSHSGGGDGNTCVEVADQDTHIAVRDSKTPARVVVTFTASAFAAFVEGLKDRPRR